MTDVHTPEVRSYNMSRIKGKDTKPELLVRKYLFSQGLRFRLHNKDLPGKPDIALAKYRIIIFIQGCFWHGHENCKYFKIPSTRKDWWINKIMKTKSLDKKHKEELEKQDWKVIEVWECELKPLLVEERLKNLIREIRNERK